MSLPISRYMSCWRSTRLDLIYSHTHDHELLEWHKNMKSGVDDLNSDFVLILLKIYSIHYIFALIFSVFWTIAGIPNSNASSFFPMNWRFFPTLDPQVPIFVVLRWFRSNQIRNILLKFDFTRLTCLCQETSIVD